MRHLKKSTKSHTGHLKGFWIFVISITVILSWTACAGNNNHRNDEFLKKLEELGYLNYIDPGNKSKIKKELGEKSWPFMVEGTKRFYFADAEDLTEGGVDEFLEKLRPFLRSQGIKLDKIEGLWGEDNYHIRINGKKYLIWSEEEYREENQKKKLALTWALSTVRTFSIVNELLESVGSTERLYATGGGNDLNAVILTRELKDAIIQDPDIHIEDKPYIPVNSPPWYGQPH